MSPSEFYAAMALPDSCALGKRVFKKLFRENAAPTAMDKRVLSGDVESIVWQYTLKPSTVPIQSYADDEREYLEVAVLEVRLKERRNAARIAEIVHRAIPYPTLIVMVHENALAMSVAHKRFSHAEHGAVVAEAFLQTPWFEGDERNTLEAAFLANLALHGLPQTHFYELYGALVARVLALACARITGRFELKDHEPEALRLERLGQCRHLQRETGEVRSKIRDESSFARQVELNARLKQLEQQLAETAAKL